MSLPRIRLDDFRELIRKHPRSPLLIACARLSIALNYGPEAETAADEKLTALWIPILFPPKLIPYVTAFATQGRIILFQGQLRMLATEALRLNPAPAEDLPPTENEALGELLLRAGELLYKPHVAVQGEQDSLANLVATFLPIYELGLPTDPIMPFDGVPQTLPHEVSLCLFRVLQESVHNAVKYSGVRVFEVALTGGANEIELSVHDSGIGFDPEAARRRHGLGLTSMRERLRLVNGQLSIESKPQYGTTILARVPLNACMPLDPGITTTTSVA